MLKYKVGDILSFDTDYSSNELWLYMIYEIKDKIYHMRKIAYNIGLDCFFDCSCKLIDQDRKWRKL